MPIPNDLLTACERLVRAADNRDNSMGDPCRLIECRAELRAAATHARTILDKIKKD